MIDKLYKVEVWEEIWWRLFGFFSLLTCVLAVFSLLAEHYGAGVATGYSIGAQLVCITMYVLNCSWNKIKKHIQQNQ